MQLLTAISDKYGFEKSEFLNQFLISSQEFKHELLNTENSDNCKKKSNKIIKKQTDTKNVVLVK